MTDTEKLKKANASRKRLAAALNAALDYQIANRGMEGHEFYACVTMGGMGKFPSWVRLAREALRKELL